MASLVAVTSNLIEEICEDAVDILVVTIVTVVDTAKVVDITEDMVVRILVLNLELFQVLVRIYVLKSRTGQDYAIAYRDADSQNFSKSQSQNQKILSQAKSDFAKMSSA